MKWKNRLTNYNFWISIVSATLLILQAFNIKLDIANVNEIVTALLGLLVVIGIINDPTKSAKDAQTEQEQSTKESENQTPNQTSENVDETSENNIIKAENNLNTSEQEQMPSDQQNADDFGTIEDNLQVLIERISQDLDQKYTALNKAVELLNETKMEQISNANEIDMDTPIEQKIDLTDLNISVEQNTQQAKQDIQQIEQIDLKNSIEQGAQQAENNATITTEQSQVKNELQTTQVDNILPEQAEQPHAEHEFIPFNIVN